MSEQDRMERPVEWLRGLEEDRFGYARLLADSGSLAVAAHRVATARCRCRSMPSEIPTVMELGAAAVEISRRAPAPGSIPRRAVLAEECEASGLLVLGPVIKAA